MKIAFIGLGQMGKPMALNLLECTDDMRRRDYTADAGESHPVIRP